ncbi:MAG TPA: acetate kinase [Bacilli bacterium]|jgi:acetate kinase|nr:acetate kinase [Acholeplasmataceae bacterium]HNZ77221.1 acetate kinase [Bacilli bacterium]HOD62103.1 acetate kinase [Bacilli bacterium]HOE06838.1 acetate kinase [Bacilli bacterium]HOH61492.1 acetate kinase [Bacilli bacterium]
MKKIMAVNAGSSSLKFQLLEMPDEVIITEGIVERIGLKDAYYTIKFNGDKEKVVLPIKDHAEAVKLVLDDLIKREIVKDLQEISGVGHRIVQGGWYFQDSAIINDDTIAKIEELCDLAPLHNPAHLIGIRAFLKVLPGVPNVAVFDTSFHQTMKPDTYMYATPYEWYEKYKIRKYGAHGTSHKYVAYVAAKLLNKPIEETKIITCHLGNGASITAVKGGICVDTSMGLTPLEGIPMGTRSGNIDPTILEYMAKKEGFTISELLVILNRKSGYLGVSGVSNDSRDLEKCLDTNERCRLALDIQYKRIADYIGSYYIQMGGLDAIVFTAGIGENSSRCREQVINRLAVLGIKLDPEANKARGEITEITTKDSLIKAFLIPTKEELMIARDVVRLTEQK